MFLHLLNLMSVRLTIQDTKEQRIRKIDLEITQCQNEINSNLRKIERLNKFNCSPNRYYNSKLKIENEIIVLNARKSELQKYHVVKYFVDFGENLYVDICRIESQIDQRKSDYNAIEKSYNESVSNRDSYIRQNDSLKRLIKTLETEKASLK
ncbi:hypothetical protein EDEG_03948 [Edhazardia aedis USNM 41457]|uniref:Uncharacterized protein n=1 Tax=Edhazardia aedis (strain USNM 41457) TaxID=1003232 RepID=J9D0R2_EDHAE|nr:hypothetical protein EDEG_03948 [Edhazardia aedis USNM 41457]|eukprot:EJW01466.1 hypothetical protein EDEG_03948 [Edhazardia aedis USNM 41457]